MTEVTVNVLVKKCPFCEKWKTAKPLLHNETEEQQKVLNDEMNVLFETHLKTCKSYEAALTIQQWKDEGIYDKLIPILTEEQFIIQVEKLMKRYSVSVDRLAELVNLGTWSRV